MYSKLLIATRNVGVFTKEPLLKHYPETHARPGPPLKIATRDLKRRKVFGQWFIPKMTEYKKKKKMVLKDG